MRPRSALSRSAARRPFRADHVVGNAAETEQREARADECKDRRLGEQVVRDAEANAEEERDDAAAQEVVEFPLALLREWGWQKALLDHQAALFESKLVLMLPDLGPVPRESGRWRHPFLDHEPALFVIELLRTP